ncbi:hypothetical protein [uncultured Phascolarctobacterium sp.]|uniref:hypothetical protein n=1 Tax=uncultured Phascolarctobacterium sp. TaxID=512296 RepID=UPI0025EEEC2F|nr:hypothetical protein [uncultured Phascolarctobacterium sp.]
MNLLPVYKPDKSQLAYNAATELDNPCFSWNARVRFPVSERCCKRNLWNNILIDAICQHKSQYLRERIGRIVNSDVVFWRMPVINGKVSLFALENIAELHAPLNFRFYNETAYFNENVDANDISICKILINDNFAYGEYYIGKETVLPVSIYKYNFSEAASIFLKDNNVVWEKDRLKIPEAVKQVELELRDEKNNIIEKICIKRISWMVKVQKLLSLKIQ